MKSLVVSLFLMLMSAVYAENWQSLMHTGEYSKAITLLDIEIESGNGSELQLMEALMSRGLCQLRLGRTDQAFNDFSKVWAKNREVQNDYMQCRLLIQICDFYLAGSMELQAREYAKEALKGATELNDKRLIAAASNALGNTELALYNRDEAMDAYKAAAKASRKSQDWFGEISAILNQEKATRKKGSSTRLSQIFDEVKKREETFQTTLLVTTVGKLALDRGDSNLAAECFDSALNSNTISEVLKLQSKFFMAYIAVEAEEFAKAQALLSPLIVETIPDSHKEIFYKIYWYYAKALEGMGRFDEALVLYPKATELLNACRKAIFASQAKLDTDFDKEIRAVFYDYVRLMIKVSEQTGEKVKWYRKSVKELEKLKMAEYQNYFEDQYILTYLNRERPLDKMVDDQTAVIYTLSWPEKSAYLVIKKGQWVLVPIEETSEKLSKSVFRLRVLASCQSLLYLKQAQLFYQDYFSHVEEHLQGIKNLVIVGDGAFQVLPFGMLNDGDSYLSNKYSISYSPGMWLCKTDKVDLKQAKLLAAGLTQSLDGVKEELDYLKNEFNAEVIAEDEFTNENLKRQLRENYFQIIHLGTHAEFAERGYGNRIQTADGKLSMGELEDWVRTGALRYEGLELLTLGACQSAMGSEEATLGLSGVAIRSGAGAVLGSLWKVDDSASAILIKSFYRHLSQGYSKSESLQRAKLELAADPTFKHPYFWAPFILIGNWY